MNIAGKLVQQDDERECVRRAFFPGGKSAGRGARNQRGETIANIAIEGLVFFEPELLGPGVEPEFADRPSFRKTRFGKPCFEAGAQAAAAFCCSTRLIAGRAETSSTRRRTFLFLSSTSAQAWLQPVSIMTGRSAALKRSPAR